MHWVGVTWHVLTQTYRKELHVYVISYIGRQLAFHWCPQPSIARFILCSGAVQGCPVCVCVHSSAEPYCAVLCSLVQCQCDGLCDTVGGSLPLNTTFNIILLFFFFTQIWVMVWMDINESHDNFHIYYYYYYHSIFLRFHSHQSNG